LLYHTFLKLIAIWLVEVFKLDPKHDLLFSEIMSRSTTNTCQGLQKYRPWTNSHRQNNSCNCCLYKYRLHAQSNFLGGGMSAGEYIIASCSGLFVRFQIILLLLGRYDAIKNCKFDLNRRIRNQGRTKWTQLLHVWLMSRLRLQLHWEKSWENFGNIFYFSFSHFFPQNGWITFSQNFPMIFLSVYDKTWP